MNFSYAIALTGGIATGKSTFGKLLKSRNFHIIDLDKIAHKLLDENFEEIEKLFGKEFVSNNQVNRKKLGNLIFNDKNEKIKLENFLHPLIRKRTKEEARKKEKLKKPYFIDIPLFFEKQEAYDIITSVLVYAPKDLQLKRLMERSKLDKTQALARIKSQMDIEEKRKKADFIVENTLDLEHLEKEAKRLEIWIKERNENIKI